MSQWCLRCQWAASLVALLQKKLHFRTVPDALYSKLGLKIRYLQIQWLITTIYLFSDSYLGARAHFQLSSTNFTNKLPAEAPHCWVVLSCASSPEGTYIDTNLWVDVNVAKNSCW